MSEDWEKYDRDVRVAALRAAEDAATSLRIIKRTLTWVAIVLTVAAVSMLTR